MSVMYDLMNETNFAGLAEHEEMLSDSVRVNAYHQGIRRNVRPGDVVVDLGTGTGLLAFMASRAGAKKVYAVEHSDFIEIAREIGIPCEVRPVHADELERADEIFVSSTAGGITGVSHHEGRPVGEGRPGPLTARIHELYWKRHEDDTLSTPIDYPA